MSAYGIDRGVYMVNGVKVFGANIVEARLNYDKLMAQPAATQQPADWYTCPGCGKSVDVGTECPICANDIPFMWEPVAIAADGNGLAVGVDY